MNILARIAVFHPFTPLVPRPRHSPDAWRAWLTHLFAVLGSALMLAGIIYFFAFNWAALPKWYKFALVEGLFILCLAGAWKVGATSRAGEVLLCAASVLVGVFWAVFGQIYQTGANTWQLFAVWAACIALWTALSRQAAQWSLFLVLCNITTALYFYTPVDGMPMRACHALLLLNLTALVAREVAHARGVAWLRPAWTGILPLLPLLCASTVMICRVLLGADHYAPARHNDTDLLFGLSCLAGLCFFFYRTRDTNRAALTLLCGFPLLNLFFVQMVAPRGHDIMMFFQLGVLNIGYSALTAYVLRHMQRTRQTAPAQPEPQPEPDDAPRPSTPEEAPPPPQARTAKGLPVIALIIQSIGGVLGAGLFGAVIAMSAMGVGNLSFLGLCVVLGALALYRAVHAHETGRVAALSFCLSMLLLGLGLCGAGFTDAWGTWPACGALSVLLALIYATCAHPLMRFTAAAIWAVMVQAAILFAWPGALAPAGQYYALLGLMTASVLPLAWLAAGRTPAAPYAPAAHAAICFLTATLLLLSTILFGTQLFAGLWLIPVFALNIELALTLLLLYAQELTMRRLSPIHLTPRRVGDALLVCLGLAALVWLNATGILLTLNLLLLGHARAQRGPRLLGLIMLPWFLTTFYYSLHTTLLAKSLILCGSGALLLCGAAWIHWRANGEATS